MERPSEGPLRPPTYSVTEVISHDRITRRDAMAGVLVTAAVSALPAVAIAMPSRSALKFLGLAELVLDAAEVTNIPRYGSNDGRWIPQARQVLRSWTCDPATLRTQ